MILNITLFSFFIALVFLFLMFFGGCTQEEETRQKEKPAQKTQITATQQSPIPEKTVVNPVDAAKQYNELGEKLVKESRYDEALEAFTKAEKMPVTDDRGLKEIPESKIMNAIEKYSNPRDALAWIDSKLAKKLEKQEPFIITGIGNIYMMCENYPGAIEVMEKGAGLHPDSLTLHYRAISAHILYIENMKLKGEEKEKNLRDASLHLKALQKITGEKHQKYFLAKGYLEIEKGDTDSAIQSFTRALDPSNESEDDKTAMTIDANYYLSLLLIEKGEYKKAEKHLTTAFSLYDQLDKDSQERYSPVRASILLLREMYCNEIASPKNFDGILNDKKFLEEVAGVYHDPHSNSLTDAQYQFIAAREKGNKTAALQQLKKLNRLLTLNATCEPYHKLISPRNITAFHTFRGDIFLKLGDKAKAKDEYMKALEYYPGDETALSRINSM